MTSPLRGIFLCLFDEILVAFAPLPGELAGFTKKVHRVCYLPGSGCLWENYGGFHEGKECIA